MKRLTLGAAASACLALAAAPPARASCASPANAIEAENCLPGTPDSVWDPPDADSSIEGFADQASVNPGSTINFKIHADTAAAYTLSVYRMGYYGGDGARLVTTISPSVPLPVVQPACLTDTATGLIDCGNWSVTAFWNVPSTATSGIYFVELYRPDNGGTNIFSFVVRNDSSHSAVVYQAEDTTQQAYNDWGGNSLYVGNPAGRAYKVSFNRPPDNIGTLWDMFEFETSMIRWLEMNSYDMSYISGVDADRSGALLLNHQIFLSVGHDEYWSLAQRNNVEAAISAGVNMAFFSGNTMFWKTRWENSIDGSNTDHRTLVCYKETTAGMAIDPLDPPTSTGLWEDPMFGPPADGGRSQSLDLAAAGDVYGPDNRDDTMNVPAAAGKFRFFRNTTLASMAAGTTMSYPQMLGYEWDEYVDNQGFPAGFIMLSSTTLDVAEHIGDDQQGNYTAGYATHHLTFYKAPSGALVFDAGTMQWGWYLDANHWIDVDPVVTPDPNIQQATMNLFADMGVQPATMQAGLIAVTKSTDTLPPASLVLTPAQTFTAGVLATVSGTAVDFGGGVVAGVEVSTDNGATWFPAQGYTNWTYSWTPAATAAATVLSRATDDSGNLEGRPTTNPVPGLTSISPSTAAVGSAGFTMSVTGAGFVSSSTVRWNGASRATVFVNGSQLSATILTSDLTAATAAGVTVFNPLPGGGTSSSMTFIVGGNPVPALVSISPASAAVGSPAFTLTLTGGGFISSSSVLWNGSSRATVFVSSTQLTAAILASDLAVSTSAVVTVFNPALGGGTSPGMIFVVGVNPMPALMELAPSSATVGAAAFSLEVMGGNFNAGSSVRWNGVSRGTVFISSGELSAALLAEDFGAPTTANVTVFNPGPGGGTSTAKAFIVGYPVPAQSSLAADLSGVWVYPNPWRADLHRGLPVKIANSTSSSEMRIFTISGRYVRTISLPDGMGTWDLNNSAGQRVASGIYIYLITDGAGHRSHGALAVIE